jgi:fructosamine-3-kinase
MHIDIDFQRHLEARFDVQFTSSERLTGGDINTVYRLKTQNYSYVIKLNNADAFPDLFQKEAKGLTEIRKTKAIDVPAVLGHGKFKKKTYLVLEYKSPGKKSNDFWRFFGHQLAEMHRSTQTKFGFFEDNYIGSLPQLNAPSQTASEFYIKQRLRPQFSMAQEQGYQFRSLDRFFKTIQQLIPEEPPALIHGDLWSGNFLVNSDQKPCLIDPAVAYASREMDIAMMKLFGGFDNKIFSTYQESFPLESNWNERILLWQLYYVLVHVNLFGGGYYKQAKDIISRYL